MDQNASFETLAQRLRVGDQDAANEIVLRYGYRLFQLARSQLDSRVRRVEDEEDVLQSVYRSFFGRFSTGKFELDTWSQLWALLSVITKRKCINRRRRAGRKGDSRADSSLDDCADHEPTPEEAASLTETVEGLMRGLEPKVRMIAELILQGLSTAEICAQLGRSERTVRRVREFIKSRLHKMQTADV